MYETSGSWLPQRHSPWESSAVGKFVIAPGNHCRVPANLGLNGLGFSRLPEKSAPHSQTGLLSQNRALEEQTSFFTKRVEEKPSTFEPPHPQQKRFLIFDQSGDQTRLIFSSPPNKPEQACIKKPVLYEESGENEIVDEGSEMHEDTEEINALLYSDDDYEDEDDANSNCKEDDEISTGHSPLPMDRDSEKQEEKDLNDEAGSLDRPSKRPRKNLPNENVHGGDVICGLNEDVGTIIGNKRPRNDKIHDTLRVLESIIPGVKSKDPLIILDEAIRYLKCLKYNAEALSEEDPDSSTCYEPLN